MRTVEFGQLPQQVGIVALLEGLLDRHERFIQRLLLNRLGRLIQGGRHQGELGFVGLVGRLNRPGVLKFESDNPHAKRPQLF